MGQARIRGSKQERIEQAIELAKTQPPKKKKLNAGQRRAVAMGAAIQIVGHVLNKVLT